MRQRVSNCCLLCAVSCGDASICFSCVALEWPPIYVSTVLTRGPFRLWMPSRHVWLCSFQDSTTPVVCLIGLTYEVLDRGTGQVGAVRIPEFIWDLLALLDLSEVAEQHLSPLRSISAEGLVMAKALVRDGVLSPREGGGGGQWLPLSGSQKFEQSIHDWSFGEI